MKLAIVGSSVLSWEQSATANWFIGHLIWSLHEAWRIEVVSGGATGIDSIAEAQAETWEIPTKIRG